MNSTRQPANLSSPETILSVQRLLADAIVLSSKLRHAHWNVRGPRFFTLHEVFGKLYDQWTGWTDDLAERLLAVGGTTVPTLRSALDSTAIHEHGQVHAARDLALSAIEDLRIVRQRAREAIDHAEAARDRGTVNLIDDVVDQLDKDVWMLTAYTGAAD